MQPISRLLARACDRLAPGGRQRVGLFKCNPQGGLVGHGTVFVVDSEQAIRAGLEKLLGSVGIETRCFACPSEFLSIPPPDSPHCLVLDVRLVGLSGLELQQELLRSGRHVPIVFLTAHGDIRTSVRAMKAGAVDFLQKPFEEQELLDAVTHALALDSQCRARRAERAAIEDRLRKLSSRERDVFRLVVAGLANKLIAARLGITEKTVKAHRGQVMRKMQVQSLADLVRLAERLDSSKTAPCCVPSLPRNA